MPHLQGFIKGWFGSWKEEARDKNSITKITGKYSFSFTTQKEITQYCRAKNNIYWMFLEPCVIHAHRLKSNDYCQMHSWCKQTFSTQLIPLNLRKWTPPCWDFELAALSGLHYQIAAIPSGTLPLSYMNRKLLLNQCQCLRALGGFHCSGFTRRRMRRLLSEIHSNTNRPIFPLVYVFFLN